MEYLVRNRPSYWSVKIDVLDNLLVGDAVVNIDPMTNDSVRWEVFWPHVTGRVYASLATINIQFYDTIYRVKAINDKCGERHNELSITLDELDNQEKK